MLRMKSTVATWMVHGLLVGVALPTIALAPEVMARMIHAAFGGGGESAVWGEPLLYMVILWLPAGLAGWAAGTVAGLGLLWWKHRARRRAS
jgi:hypothetical protein